MGKDKSGSQTHLLFQEQVSVSNGPICQNVQKFQTFPLLNVLTQHFKPFVSLSTVLIMPFVVRQPTQDHVTSKETRARLLKEV